MFVETETLPQERKSLGYKALGEQYDFVINTTKGAEYEKRAVIGTCEEKPFAKDACIEKSKKYDKNLCYTPILNLYNEILKI